MSTSEPDSTVVVDGSVSDEKRDELRLLAFQTEYPDLGFKQMMDLQRTRGKVELLALITVSSSDLITEIPHPGWACS